MPVTYAIDAWHADVAHLNSWKRDAIAAAVCDDVAPEARALRVSHVLTSYNLQLSALESYYAEELMPELSEEEYKNFQAMQKQSTVVDKVLLVGCAFVVFWFILAVVGALVAAKA